MCFENEGYDESKEEPSKVEACGYDSFMGQCRQLHSLMQWSSNSHIALICYELHIFFGFVSSDSSFLLGVWLSFNEEKHPVRFHFIL